MEITVRTAEEIAADRVTIEVNGARLYTAAEVGDAQASEAELVAAPLRRRIVELETALDARDFAAEGEESEARRRVIELTADLAATRCELYEARRVIEFKAAALGKVAGAVTGTHVLGALRNPWTIWTETEAVALAGAVRDVRRITGLPELGS
jgi:hypothetical protein